MSTVATALDSARSLLNDDASITWSNALLLSKLKEAYRELVLELTLNGLQVIRELSSIITVTAGDTSLGNNLPSDIIEVISVAERTSGSSERFSDMKELLAIPPGLRPINTLQYWAWREEVIEFAESTADREVFVTYKKSLSTPTKLTESLGFLQAELFIGPRTASLALVGRDDKLSSTFNTQARANLEKIIRLNVTGSQSLRTRRRPYWSTRFGSLPWRR